jgi:hypothetical protein
VAPMVPVTDTGEVGDPLGEGGAMAVGMVGSLRDGASL